MPFGQPRVHSVSIPSPASLAELEHDLHETFCAYFSHQSVGMVFAPAAVTKYRRLGGLTSRH